MSYSYPTELTASGLVSDTQGKLDSLINFFDLASEPTNGHILSYNSTSKKIVAIANSGGGGGSGIASVVADTSPQLGGALDINGQQIVSTSNQAIEIKPNGTGDVHLGNFVFDADQTVGSSQNDYALVYNHSTGKIGLEAQAGGGSGIALTDLSVSTASASGGGALAYNNSTGVFTFTPASPTGGSTFTDTIQAQGALSMYCSDSGTSNSSTIVGIGLKLRSTTASFNSGTGAMNTDGADDNITFESNKILLSGSRDKNIFNQSVGDVLIRTQETESGSTQINIQHDENIVSVTGVLQLDTQSSDPTSNLANGQMYYNTSTNKFRGYANGAWVDLH